MFSCKLLPYKKTACSPEIRLGNNTSCQLVRILVNTLLIKVQRLKGLNLEKSVGPGWEQITGKGFRQLLPRLE